MQIGEKPDTSLDADARGLHARNAKDNTAFSWMEMAWNLMRFLGQTQQNTHIAALENYQGAGKLHLHDSSKPSLSFFAWVDVWNSQRRGSNGGKVNQGFRSR
jgi:hypothetical protein